MDDFASAIAKAVTNLDDPGQEKEQKQTESHKEEKHKESAQKVEQPKIKIMSPGIKGIHVPDQVQKPQSKSK